jgi:hypothetical protein
MFDAQCIRCVCYLWCCPVFEFSAGNITFEGIVDLGLGDINVVELHLAFSAHI